MNLNADTILKYMHDTLDKIELIRVDIQAYQHRIVSAEKEIKTLEYLLEQYEKAIEMIEVDHATKIY